MRTRIFVLIIVTLLITLVWLLAFENHTRVTPLACTMEARICSDGTAVGRTGPHCEFSPCPVTKNPQEEGGEMIACTMDVRVCSDGTSVGRVAPSCEFSPCPTTQVGIKNLMLVSIPTPNQTVMSPVTIQGIARGSWFFEGSFPVSIVNWDGLIIGEGVATAEDEWMTEDFVPFTADITYTISPDTPYDRGAIILRKDNPSGLPEHDNALEIPIIFGEYGLSVQ